MMADFYLEDEPVVMAPDHCHRCALDALDAVTAELAALKARRCDGCVWYGADSDTATFGECAWFDAYLTVDASHHCASWEAAS